MIWILRVTACRYTEWAKRDEAHGGTVDWGILAGTELYDHSADPLENTNVVARAPPGLVAELSTTLRAGWRAAATPPVPGTP